jgi:glycosyltransferase involved in cell wall biosynthesis
VGVVVAPPAPHARARALLDCFARPERAAGIGREARRTACDRFDLDAVIAPAYERLYAEMAERGPRA